MSNFSFPQPPKITKENDKKWYISYIIVYDELVDGKYKHYRKENGLKNYDVKINKYKDPQDREAKAEKLRLDVLRDLENGIDPSKKFFNRVEKIRLKKLEAQKNEDAKITLDAAIKMTADAKGWSGKVADGKEITASNMLSLLKNGFGNYVRIIKKDNDVREITRNDIKNWIELHFNSSDEHLKPNGKRLYANWSAATCETNKNTVSIMFSVLLERELISVNPCLQIKIKTDSEKIHQDFESDEDRYEMWTQDELDIFWKETDTDELRFYNVFAKCIHYSFIRKTEIFRIRATMVDLANERFAIPAKLTKAARKYKNPNELVMIDIPDSLLISLKKWLNQIYPNGYTQENYLFPHPKNDKKPFMYRTFNHNWIVLRKQLQDKYPGHFEKNIYSLKHNGISAYFHFLLTQKNLTPAQVVLDIQTQARHSSFQETENYLRNHNLLFKEGRRKANF